MSYVWILALGVSGAAAEESVVLGANPSCLVDGTWFSAVGEKVVETSFGAGTLTTTTADGRRSAAYEVVDGALVLSGGSLGRARGEADSCTTPTPATYRLQWSADCWQLALVAEEDGCARRRGQLEAMRWTRGR